VVIGLYRNERQVPVEELIRTLSDPSLSAIVYDKHTLRGRWPHFTLDEALAFMREAGFVEEERFGDFLLLTRSEREHSEGD
jgi:hypothetical protein